MPGFSTPARPGGEHDEPLLDMIFDGRAIPPDAPTEMHDLERMLAALAGPAEPGELAGEAAARAAFIGLASPASVSPAAARPAARRPASHRPGRRTPARRRAGLLTALAAAAAVLVSAAAAYAGVLPEPIQQVAHVTVGAPAPRPHHSSARAGSGSRQDTRPAPGRPTPRPGHSAVADHARVAAPRHEPPIRPSLAGTCTPRPAPHQGLEGPSRPDPGPACSGSCPSAQGIPAGCPGALGQPAGQGR